MNEYQSKILTESFKKGKEFASKHFIDRFSEIRMESDAKLPALRAESQAFSAGYLFVAYKLSGDTFYKRNATTRRRNAVFLFERNQYETA